jgi:hypothetical protein
MLRGGVLLRVSRKVRRTAVQYGTVLLLYGMLVAAATWPVIEHLNTAVIGRGTDAFVHLWLFHWIEDTLREGSVSFFTDRLFYPTGVSLLNQTIAWLNAALWLLVKPLVGAIPAYSLLVLGLMVFNGFALFLFVHDLTHIWEASVVAGTVALLWPALLDHSFQVSLLPIGFVVMALRSLRRLLDQGRASDMAKLGIWLGLIGMLRFQMLIFGAFLWGFYAIVRLARMDFQAVWQRVRLIGGSGGIGALLSAPFTLPYLLYHFRVRGPGDLVPPFSNGHISDLVYYFLPRRAHLILARVTETVIRLYDLKLDPNCPALGWVTLGLVLIAWVYYVRRVRLWGALAGLLLILALGPRPHILGAVIDVGPYARAYEAFLIPVLREPSRFDMFLAIPMGIMAGWGMKGVLDLLQDRTFTWLSVVIGVVLILLDSVVWPHYHLPLEVPSWHASLVDDPEAYGLLEIPMSRQESEWYMMYQLTHDKPLVYGHVSRVPEGAYAFVDAVPLLAHLEYEDSSAPPSGDFNLAASLDRLNDAGVRYVVIHRDFMPAGKVREWQRWFLYPPLYKDSGLCVYPTDWRDAVEIGPVTSASARLLDVTLNPGSTVPGGWVEMQTAWYVPADAPEGMTLSLHNGEDLPVNTWSGITLFGAASDRAGKDELLWRAYRAQIPPKTEPGVHRFCFTPADGRGREDAGHDPVFCYEYAVEARVRTFAPPDSAEAVGVTFGGSVELVGFTSAISDDTLRLQLVWQAVREMTTSYKMFVHVLDTQTGAVAAQEDFISRDWTYPTTYWQAGEYVEDAITLDLGATAPGSYEVRVGVYDSTTGERLVTVSDEDSLRLMKFER